MRAAATAIRVSVVLAGLLGATLPSAGQSPSQPQWGFEVLGAKLVDKLDYLEVAEGRRWLQVWVELRPPAGKTGLALADVAAIDDTSEQYAPHALDCAGPPAPEPYFIVLADLTQGRPNHARPSNNWWGGLFDKETGKKKGWFCGFQGQYKQHVLTLSKADPGGATLSLGDYSTKRKSCRVVLLFPVPVKATRFELRIGDAKAPVEVTGPAGR